VIPAPVALVSPRRVVVYILTEARGRIDEYVTRALRGLRPHAERIVVICADQALPEDERARLADVADAVIEGPGTGYHVAAFRHGAQYVERHHPDADEVLFATDTWFGPVGSFDDVFTRMDEQAVHLWSMTDHLGAERNPYGGEDPLPPHAQWHWLAVRGPLLRSRQWRDYWRPVPVAATAAEAFSRFEASFSQHFADLGFPAAVAFPAAESPTADPSLLNADLLLEAGCPILRRRTFSDWPPYLAHEAVVGSWVLQTAEGRGYPAALILEHLARVVPPKVLNADADLLEVVSDVEGGYDPSRPLRVVVVAHIFYEDMTDELLDRADNLPQPYDLVVTSPDAAKAESIRVIVAARERGPASVDVRVVPSNDGRDQSAFFIGCRDILLDDRYDLVVKIHSKKSPQDGYAIGQHFKRQQVTNLLNSPGFAGNLLGLFQREERLGLVFPPMVHIGAPTMGRGWAVNKPGFAELAAKLGIRVPLDDVSPLAPFGSMYVARPRALRLMAEPEWDYSDFGGQGAYRDGGLAHIMERMPAYAAGELGMYARTVANREYMSVSHTALDFKLDQMAATTPGYLDEQIALLRRAGFWGDMKLRQFVLMYVRLRRPKLERATRNALAIGPKTRHLWWRACRPATWRRGWDRNGTSGQ